MDIANMLAPERVILSLGGNDKKDALVEIINNLGTSGAVTDIESLKKAILDREELMSTGVGLTIAVPHAKLSSVKAFTLSIARSQRGIDYDSLDGKPVNIIVAIAAPDNDQNTYLRVLAAVMGVLREEKNRAAIMDAKSADEVLAVFRT